MAMMYSSGSTEGGPNSYGECWRVGQVGVATMYSSGSTEGGPNSYGECWWVGQGVCLQCTPGVDSYREQLVVRNIDSWV